jgi:hypothetical protein
MSLITINADLSRVATALERLVEIAETVYRDDLVPREPPPKPKPGKLFVQTNDNLLEIEYEEARRAGYVDWNGRDEDTEGEV